MKNLFLLFALLTLASLQAHSQKKGQDLIDSLLLELPKAVDDTNKVKLLNQLSYNYFYINTTEGVKVGKEALELATKLNWTPGIATSQYAIGGNYANKADYASALDYEYKALKFYEQLNDKTKQALMLRNIGIVLHRSKNYAKALEYAGKALGMYRDLKDKEGEAAIYNNMANTYYRLKDNERVLEYDFKALHLYEEIRNSEGATRMLGNIANFYAEMGEFAKSMVYYFSALRKEIELKNKDGITRNLGNIGETYLDISKEEPVKTKPDSLIPAGKSANLKKALEFLGRSVNDAKEQGQAEYYIAYAEVFSEAKMLSGQYREALDIYREYIAVRDSVYDVEKYNEATRKELDYEYGKREDSITYQKKITDVQLVQEKRIREREKIFYTSGLALVLIFSGFMYNRWRLTQRQKRIIEKEKQRSDELLLNILPEEVAEELKEKGKADAKQFDEVTVLFTDFKNFTSISEKLSAQELVNEINFCYSEFDKIISTHGIEKIKTIGDAYMCAGGLPVSNKTHAEDTVKAGLAIRDFMLREKLKREALGKTFFEIRIGIHTGQVVAGIVGIKKFAYDIWGDTVNIASRMEGSGEPGKVNISGETHLLVKTKFNCTHRGKIQAKNKGEIDMYFVEGPS